LFFTADRAVTTAATLVRGEPPAEGVSILGPQCYSIPVSNEGESAKERPHHLPASPHVFNTAITVRFFPP
jgi:hypothetical protein